MISVIQHGKEQFDVLTNLDGALSTDTIIQGYFFDGQTTI
jgi:hypothetical protein